MAQGWNSDAERDAMLRRVAIVLSSFPASVANRLIGTMAEDSKAAVRRTMTTLSDVDPLERQRALQAFRVSIQRQPQPQAVGGVTPVADATPAAGVNPVSGIQSGPTSRVMSSERIDVSAGQVDGNSNSSRPFESAHHASDSPLSFLSDIDDDTLFMLVSAEHPQAIAFVLASIAPVQAARIIPRLDDKLRRETLSRLGRLGEVPEEAAAEVAKHFRDRLQDRSRDGHPHTGRRALDAILAALPNELQADPWHSSSSPSQAPTPVTTDSPVDFPTSDRPAINLSDKLRQAVASDGVMNRDQTPHDQVPVAPIPESPIPESPTSDSGATTRAAHVDHVLAGDVDPNQNAATESLLNSTDSIHQHLISLSPIELCQALGKVDTRDAMLTLCGLPNSVTEAALSVLPRAQAKKARASMNGLGSVQLREIDEAKERVAHASLSASDAALSPMPVAA